ncbi:MAG: PHP domain-containing protein [bacterium]|nr:PHP domain-containing protein [bacterium]
MELVDLHVHSNASDGTCSPTEVVSLAQQKGLCAIALTDHDTVDGVAEALLAAKGSSLTVIPGTELSCTFEGKEIHILGLFLNLEDSAFLEELSRLRKIRDKRNQEMLSRFLADGISITREDLCLENPNTVITRAHFAHALVSLGYAKDMDSAFKKYLQYGGRYCMPKKEISYQHAMEILTKNHAVPILAHPLQYKLDRPKLLELLATLKELGLVGLECYHSSNNEYESRILKEMADSYGLLPSGGSDFHGENKPHISIGSGRGGLRISKLLLDDLRAKATNI